MQTHADKSQLNKNRAVSNQPSGTVDGSHPTFDVEDNRPEAIQLEELQAMVDNSPQAVHISHLQAMAHNRGAGQMTASAPVRPKGSIPSDNSPEVAQLVQMDESNVTPEVLKVYRSLDPLARAYIRNTESMDEFFELSSDLQIRFLNTLQKSLPVLDAIIQQQAVPQGPTRAIEGPVAPDLLPTTDLGELRARFFRLNPDFINQSLRLLVLDREAVFHFYNPDGNVTIGISSLAALMEPGPVGMLEGAERPDTPSIQQVMAQNTLKGFMLAQHLFQLDLELMDGLESSGLEFEFASFALPGGTYQEEEIIPSHKTMASTGVFGQRFGLAWKLESDSKNTLELVTPPFVYPRSRVGQDKRQQVMAEITNQTHAIAQQLEDQRGTLSAAAAKLAAAGIGTGWQVEDPYRSFVVVKNQKTGGAVYSQENVSMFPEEIGALLERTFERQGGIIPHITNPVGLALMIRQALNESLQRLLSQHKPKTTDGTAVKNAIAVFARYASNATSIPSMRHRQDTGERKDTLPTQVKETLGYWVKTDALNLLKPILAKSEDLQLFTAALDQGAGDVVNLFRDVRERMIQSAAPKMFLAKKELEIDPVLLKDRYLLLKKQKPDAKLTDLMALAKEQLAPRTVEGPDPVEQMTGYTGVMMDEVTAFIDRALHVADHVETDPTSTTEEFLGERYGTGEGLRKGTYIKGIPTSKGNMYVTEIR